MWRDQEQLRTLLFLLHVPGPTSPAESWDLGANTLHRILRPPPGPQQLRGGAGSRLHPSRSNTALVSAAAAEALPFPPALPPNPHRWAAGAHECVCKHTGPATCALAGAHERSPCPWCHPESQQLGRNLVPHLLPPSFGERAFMSFISWTIRNLFSEEIDVVPHIFPPERWSELTVGAGKNNVSQQLTTTKKAAEPRRKVLEGDTAKNLWLPKEAVNRLSPGAQGREPPAKGKLSDGSRGPAPQEPRVWVLSWATWTSGHGGPACG